MAAKKKTKKKIINGTAQFDEMSPENFKFKESQFIYKVHRQTGEITLLKSGRELPLDIKNQFDITGAAGNVIKPPWDTYELEWLIRHNHTHRRCMELKAMLICGLGYDFENTKHKNFEKLEKFMRRPNTTFGDTGTKIMVKLQRQKGIYGYGPLLINKAFDTIQMFAAMNTKSTFVIPNTRNGYNTTGIRKYVQLSKNSSAKVEFFPYDGNPRIGRSYMHWIGYKTISSSYYPEPEYLPALDKIYEDIFVDKNNIDFFKNRAMGDFAILISGTKLSTKSKDTVQQQYKDNMNQFKGIGNQHKTMVLESPGKDAKIQIVDLSTNEDGQYSKRQQALESSIARSWGIMPSLISLTKGGSGMGGGSVGISDLFLENQIMTRAEQEEFEEDMNLILESLFEFDPGIKFRTLDNINQKDQAVIVHQLVSAGVNITQSDIRKFIHRHGLMELTTPDIVPPEEECVIPYSTVNIDGDRKGDGSLEDEPDGINNIDEDKFNDEK